jgi:hypothetical protein
LNWADLGLFLPPSTGGYGLTSPNDPFYGKTLLHLVQHRSDGGRIQRIDARDEPPSVLNAGFPDRI